MRRDDTHERVVFLPIVRDQPGLSQVINTHV